MTEQPDRTRRRRRRIQTFRATLLTSRVHLFLLSVSIALLCSFLLGLGDSCFNTQLYSILGRVYADQSTAAFAIFKFIQVKFPLADRLRCVCVCF